jgi:hypothetical protein
MLQGRTVSKLFTWVAVVESCVEHLVTNKFFFYGVMKSSVSCHLVVIKSCNLNIVIMCYNFFFIIDFFFLYYDLIVVVIMSLIFFFSYVHHQASMIIHHHNKFFFFCYHRSCCSVLLHNTCGAVRSLWSRVFASLSCVTP